MRSSNMYKRIIALVIAFALTIPLLPMSILAADVEDVDVYTDMYGNVTDDSVRVTGYAEVDPESDLKEKGIAFWVEDEGESSKEHESDNDSVSDEISVVLTDLQPDTEYIAQAYVIYYDDVDHDWEFKYGNEVSFKTTGNQNGINIDIDMNGVYYKDSDEADAHAKIDAPTSLDLNVGFVYDDDNTYPTVSDQKVQEDWDQDDDYQLVLTGLSNDTYYVRAFVEYDGNYYYSDSTTYRHREGGSNNSDDVSTSSAVYENLKIKATGYTEDVDVEDLDERGFVYSPSNLTPTLSDSKAVSDNKKDEKFTAEWSVDPSNSTYYVRAYATEDGETDYGNIVKVDIGTNLPIVNTKAVTKVTVNSAEVLIDVTRAGNSSIIERGVVYSATNTKPELYNSNTKYKATAGTLGEATLTIDGLEPNTKYYVRSYAKNNDGTSYGETLEFFTVSGDSIKTYEPTINGTTVTAKGSVNNFKPENIKEKGFVYSKTNQVPSINDMKVSANNTTLGDFALDITNLEKDSTYYISTYVKTDQGYMYGNVVNFKTSAQEVNLVVSFTDTNGQVVGTQQIPTQMGAQIPVKSLNIPVGYALVTYQEIFHVTGSTLNIPVNKIGGTEMPFMEGVGGNKFEPDKATTRAEVAQVIYNLAENKTPGTTSMVFTDVPSTHPNKLAIDYCSSKNYMRGYPDGTFKPNANITRSEVCVVLTLVYSLQGQAYSDFKDVPNDYWGYPYISLAFNNDMIYGYPDGSFKPDYNMSRAEVATLFCNAEDRSLKPLGNRDFVDVPKDHWAYKYVMNAAIPKP